MSIRDAPKSMKLYNRQDFASFPYRNNRSFDLSDNRSPLNDLGPRATISSLPRPPDANQFGENVRESDAECTDSRSSRNEGCSAGRQGRRQAS
jgi:hypothetical protein